MTGLFLSKDELRELTGYQKTRGHIYKVNTLS